MLRLSSMLPFTSMLYLTSMLPLGFDASLHFDAEVTSSVTMFFFNVTLNLTPMLSFTSMLYLISMLRHGFNASLYSNALSRFQPFPSLRRRGHIECDHVFFQKSPSISLQCFPSLQCFISLQCFVMVSILPSTPMLYLGFDPSLRFDAEVTSSVTMFFCLVTLNFTAMLSFTSMLHLTSMLRHGFKTSLYSNALSRFQPFPSLRRRGHIECDHVFFQKSPSISLQCFPSLQCFISLQCFVMVSILPSTPMLYLGFNPSLHFDAEVTLSVNMFCF